MARIIAAFAAVLALVLTPGPAIAKVGDPHFEEPTVGECHNYGIGSFTAASETSAPVDCATSHTAKVIAVAMLPAGVTWANATTAQLTSITMKKCVPAYRAILGGGSDKNRHMSAYALGWFVPTQAQREGGAEWLRCDLVIIRGRSSLRPLPTDSAPFLPAKPFPKTVASCLTPTTLYVTDCAGKHAYRATGSFTRTGAYPSAKQLKQIVLQRCPKLVSTRSFGYTIRDKTWWNLGDHSIVCFSKRSN